MLARRLGGIPGLDFTLAETLEFRGVFWLQLLAQSYFAALALAACVFFAERHLRYLLLTLAILAVIVLLEAGLGSKGGLLGPLLILLAGQTGRIHGPGAAYVRARRAQRVYRRRHLVPSNAILLILVAGRCDRGLSLWSDTQLGAATTPGKARRVSCCPLRGLSVLRDPLRAGSLL